MHIRKESRNEFDHGTQCERCGLTWPTHRLQHVRHVCGTLPDGSDGRAWSGVLAAGQSERQGSRLQPLREGGGGDRFRARRPASAVALDPHGTARRWPVAAHVVGRGARLHRRHVEGNHRGIRWSRHCPLGSFGSLHRPDQDFLAGTRLTELLQPRRLLRRQRPQRRSITHWIQPCGVDPRHEARQASRAVRTQHRRIADGQRGQGFHGGDRRRHALHLHRSAPRSLHARPLAIGRCDPTATTH